MMQDERPRAATTTAAGVLILLVCIPFLVNGWDLYKLIVEPGSADTELRDALIVSGSGSGAQATRTFAIFGAGVTLGLCALAVMLAWGVLRRREGAHHAAIITFAILGLIALAASTQGLTADPPAENAKVGLLVGCVDAAIVILLLLESTRDDFEYMENIRLRQKYAKQDARAAKRAARH
jgi:hypothetical protein